MYQGKPPPEAKYMFFAGWKVPSPLNSLTTMPEGPFLDPATYSTWGLNSGVCANVGCGNANRKNKVAATNNDNLPSFLFMEHLTGEFEPHATQLQKHRKNRSLDLLSAPNKEDANHKNPLFVLKPFSALTLREGLGADQSVKHLNSIWKKPGRNLDFPSTNYLSSYFGASTESGALRPTARSSSYCRHHVVWHGRIRLAGWSDERVWKSNCLASSLQEWIKAHGPSMAAVPKQPKNRKASRPLLRRRPAQSGT